MNKLILLNYPHFEYALHVFILQDTKLTAVLKTPSVQI